MTKEAGRREAFAAARPPTVAGKQRLAGRRIRYDRRFPLLCVVPVTGAPGEGALYPPLGPGQSGLTKASYALVDHLRSVDKRRVRRVFGRLAPPELAAVDEGLALLLGLGDRLEP